MARACIGQAPGAARRSPIRRSASPRRTGSATRGRSIGSSDPSQSMKHTTWARAAVRPAKHADPKPGTDSTTTWAPSDAARGPEPSLEPLSTTMGRNPSGIRLRTHGMASASSRTGRITSRRTAPSTWWSARKPTFATFLSACLPPG